MMNAENGSLAHLVESRSLVAPLARPRGALVAGKLQQGDQGDLSFGDHKAVDESVESDATLST